MEACSFIFGLVVMLVIGGFLGRLFERKKLKKEPSGTLRIDTSDPDGPYLFLELREDIPKVIEKEEVVLEVNTENYISHE